MSETKTTERKEYGPKRPKVPAFRRYEGTSAWRKYRAKRRAYAWMKAQSTEG